MYKRQRFFYAVSLIFVFFVSGCTNSDKVDPDEVIKEFGQDAQQLSLIHILDEIARMASASITQKKFKALVDKVNIGGQSVLLMKPQTYMNNSGEAVRAAMDFYHLQPQDLLVIYDDMDLALSLIHIF